MNRIVVVGVLTAFAVAAPSVAEEPFRKRSGIVVDDFDGLQNHLQGYRNTFQKSPSAAVALRESGARFGHDGWGLRLTADRRDAGYCGVWIHFFDMRVSPHQYFDATEFQYLSFWVKGTAGGERFKIKVADDIWIAKEDSVAIGEITEFLEGGVTTRWQQVRIPLDEKYGLNLKRLGGLTLDFDVPGRFTICIDQIEFESSRPPQAKQVGAIVNGNPPPRAVPGGAVPGGAVTVAAGAPQVTASRPHGQANPPPGQSRRAIWLWTTEALLDDRDRAEDFFRFCNTHSIKDVWAQLLYEMKIERQGNRVTKSRCLIRRQTELRHFLIAAHDAGLRVHALEGLPEHAQRQYHHISIAIVDAVLEFNTGPSPAERFDGIHFDNEPYLLVGWHDPQLRKQILYEFLTLNCECQRRVRAASPRIEFGVDIPFWWQDRDEHGEPHGVVTFQGVRQAASLHLLERLDNVGVMNYRDAAQGADGMIAHARDLLIHADQTRGAKVFLGVETCAFEPTEVVFAVGRSRREFEQSVRGQASALAQLSRLEGHRLRVIQDAGNVHVGIEAGDTETIAGRIQLAKTMSRVTSHFAIDCQQQSARVCQESLTQWLIRAPQWTNVKPCSVRDPQTGKTHLLVKADSLVPGKITFADENPKQFAVQTKLAEEQFAKHRSYAGLAIHHYDSFREFVNRSTRPRQREGNDTPHTLTSAR